MTWDTQSWESKESGTQLLLEKVKSQGYLLRSMSAASRTVGAVQGQVS